MIMIMIMWKIIMWKEPIIYVADIDFIAVYSNKV